MPPRHPGKVPCQTLKPDCRNQPWGAYSIHHYVSSILICVSDRMSIRVYICNEASQSLTDNQASVWSRKESSSSTPPGQRHQRC